MQYGLQKQFPLEGATSVSGTRFRYVDLRDSPPKLIRVRRRRQDQGVHRIRPRRSQQPEYIHRRRGVGYDQVACRTVADGGALPAVLSGTMEFNLLLAG